MEHLKTLGNWAFLVLLYAVVVIAAGAWWRLMVKLFCIGYGC